MRFRGMDLVESKLNDILGKDIQHIVRKLLRACHIVRLLINVDLPLFQEEKVDNLEIIGIGEKEQSEGKWESRKGNLVSWWVVNVL